MKTLPECAGCPGVLADDTYDLTECAGCDTLPAELRAVAEATPDPDVDQCDRCKKSTGDLIHRPTLASDFICTECDRPPEDVVATAKTGWKTPREIAAEGTEGNLFPNSDPRLAKSEQATDIGRAIAYLLELEPRHQGDGWYNFETAPGYGTKTYAGLARFMGRIFSDSKFLAQLIKDAEALPGEGSRPTSDSR